MEEKKELPIHEMEEMIRRECSHGEKDRKITYHLDLLKTGKFSDFTIRCQGHEFRVHRTIVCYKSTYFQSICDSNFKESLEQSLNLPNDDPDVIAANLACIYRQYASPGYHFDGDGAPGYDFDRDGEYSIFLVVASGLSLMSKAMPYDRFLLLLVKTYTVADRFLLADVKATILQTISHHQLGTVGGCYEVPELAAAVQWLYSRDTPQELRNVCVCAAHRANRIFSYEADGAEGEAFRDLLRSEADFAYDYIYRCRPGCVMRCNSCQKTSYLSEYDCPRGDAHVCGGICYSVALAELKCRRCKKKGNLDEFLP